MLAGSMVGVVLLAAAAAPGGNRSSASRQAALGATQAQALPAARTDGEEEISYRFTAFEAKITGLTEDRGRGHGTGSAAHEVERVTAEDSKLRFSVGIGEFFESVKFTGVHLGLTVTESNDASCPKGRRGEVVATDIHEKGKASADFVRIGVCR